MARAQWVKWKKGGGPRVRGTLKYDPPQPHGPWTKIMGVVARCEGCHDTVVMYDETGVTWGFLQWTFKSGRLQKLLESFKSIPAYDFEEEGVHHTLFDLVCCESLPQLTQKFERFGFKIEGGKFVDLNRGRVLKMTNKTQRKRCVDICMGRVQYPGNLKKQKQHAMALARVFDGIGNEFGVAEAQVQFAKQEFKRQMKYKRPPLGGKSIAKLLTTKDGLMYEYPLVALFFNLWQNNPGAAYRLFLKAKKVLSGDFSDSFFHQAWTLANRSKFGNWGWKKGAKSPRVVRIKKAIKEFYGMDVPYHK